MLLLARDKSGLQLSQAPGCLGN